MKLMIDASLQSVGGGVQVAVNLINNVLSTNFANECLVIVSPQVDKQIDIKYKKNENYIVFENTKGFLKFIQGRKLAKLESKFNPDLVFIVFGPSYWKPKTKSIQGFAIPHMVYPQISDLLYKRKPIKKILLNFLLKIKKNQILSNYEYMLVETETFKKLVSNKIGFDEKNIFVVENSFNNKFDKNISGQPISKNNIINFFVPSAYYPHKNLEILIDVAFILKNKYKMNFKFNFLIQEKSEDWSRLINLASLKNVQSCLNTYGPVNNKLMANLYRENDFVILPTLAEVSTAVYPESFVSRKLIFTSDLDFAKELCGEGAIYFDPLDSSDIALKIYQVINDTELQNKVIECGSLQLSKKYISPEEKWEKQKKLINFVLSK